MIISDVKRRFYDRLAYAQTTLDTIPASTTSGAVTITTDGTYFSVSADISLRAGDWIFDSSAEEVRMIVKVFSDTEGELLSAFTSDISSSTFKYVKSSDLEGIWAVSIKVTGSSGGDIDGLTYDEDDTYQVSLPMPSESSQDCQMRPIIVDGTSSKDCNVVINKIST